MSKGQQGGKHCNTDEKHSQKTPDFSKKPLFNCLHLFLYIKRLVSFQLLATSKRCTVSLLFGDHFIILLDYLLMVYLTPKTQIKICII